MSRTRSGIDGLSSHLGFQWEAADRVRMTIRASRLDRRNDRVAVLRSEVTHEDGRLLATAIGSCSIFPETRLSERRPRRGFQSPEPG